MNYINTTQAAQLLEVSSDEVRRFLREKRLFAKKSEGNKGDYFIHSVDVVRLRELKKLYLQPQDVTQPDMMWVSSACKYLIERLQALSYSPSAVIGLLYGGICPASFISAYLRIPLYLLYTEHYVGKDVLENVTIPSKLPFSLDINETKLLVVDDISDTGETLTAVQKLLQREGYFDTKFVTLHKNVKSIFDPDVYVTITDEWITYPWEKENA